MTPVVRLENVSKSYDEGGRLRVVLEAVSAVIPAAEFVAIRGRSGSGKSTLLNLVAGIDSPTTGDVFLERVCVNRLPPRDRTLLRRDRIGFVFQAFNLIPTLTAVENVALPVELRGAPRREARRRAAAFLERVALGDRLDTFPDRLSGGEQQRVAIARALVHEPAIILADEPTGNLDERTSEGVLTLLEDLTRRSGRTLLLVTHSTQVASRADRELSIEGGRLVTDRG